jgi:hopanoid-associated phosphorylase
VIVIAGLAFEARIAAGSGLRVICSGDGKDLAAKISRSITRDCRGLISFGVSGGLAPDLEPGACVIGSAIISSTGKHETDSHWSNRLLDVCPNPVYGPLAGVAEPVADPGAKRALHQQTGAIAVDMESHIVAGVAAARGLPMVAIRVVTDPAQRAIPRTALATMRPNGSVDLRAMLRSLIQTPGDITGLLRLAFDARAARSTLRKSRHALGPRFSAPEPRGHEHGLAEKFGLHSPHRTNPVPYGFTPYLPAANLLADHRAFQKAE